MVIALLPVTSVVASLSPPTLLSATSVSSTSSLALATSSAIALTTEVEAIVVAPVLGGARDRRPAERNAASRAGRRRRRLDATSRLVRAVVGGHAVEVLALTERATRR